MTNLAFDSLRPAFIACPYDKACVGNDVCGPEYLGFLCLDCAVGFGGTVGGACGPCFDGRVQYMFLLVVFIMLGIGSVVLVRMSMGRKNQLSLLFKMATNFLQMFTTVTSYQYFIQSGAGLTAGITNIASIINFAGTIDSPALSCSAGGGYYAKFFFTMTIPIILVFLPFVMLLTYAFFAHILFGQPYSMDAVLKVTVTASIIMIFFMQNSVVFAALQFFNCKSVAEGGYLLVDPRTSCFSTEHIALKSVAGFFAFFYGIGIPILGFALLFRVRKSMQLNSTLKYYGFLYDGFNIDRNVDSVSEPLEYLQRFPVYWPRWCCCSLRVPLRPVLESLAVEVWWYECFVMVRKLVFVAIGILIENGAVQLIVALFLLLFFIWHQMQLAPYSTPRFNQLETSTLVLNVILFLAVLVLNFIKTGAIGDSFASNTMTVFVWICVALLGIYFLASSLSTFFMMRQLQIEADPIVAMRRRVLTEGTVNTRRTADSEMADLVRVNVTDNGLVSLVSRISAAGVHAHMRAVSLYGGESKLNRSGAGVGKGVDAREVATRRLQAHLVRMATVKSSPTASPRVDIIDNNDEGYEDIFETASPMLAKIVDSDERENTENDSVAEEKSIHRASTIGGGGVDENSDGLSPGAVGRLIPDADPIAIIARAARAWWGVSNAEAPPPHSPASMGLSVRRIAARLEGVDNTNSDRTAIGATTTTATTSSASSATRNPLFIARTANTGAFARSSPSSSSHHDPATIQKSIQALRAASAPPAPHQRNSLPPPISPGFAGAGHQSPSPRQILTVASQVQRQLSPLPPPIPIPTQPLSPMSPFDLSTDTPNNFAYERGLDIYAPLPQRRASALTLNRASSPPMPQHEPNPLAHGGGGEGGFTSGKLTKTMPASLRRLG